jgi:catechol 2,3-dioxygenase-like lactoylglutathione lyase family enzyme
VTIPAVPKEQSVSVPDVVSTIIAQAATTLQHGRRIQMIDHVYISVTNVEKSLAFYAEALKPIGWSLFGNYDAASGPEGVPDLHGLGDNAYVSGTGLGSSIWLRQRKLGETGLYLGLVCDSNELWMLRTPPPSKRVARTGVSPPTGPTSRRATMPPTSPTLTAITWSSCTRLGTPHASWVRRPTRRPALQ